MATPPRTLAVGSHPDLKKPGGIITHLRILRELEALKPIEVVDLGSLHGSAAIQKRWAILTILCNLFRFRTKLKHTRYDIVMFHQPITPGALVKLLIALLFVPRSGYHSLLVFFHGGRFENIRYLQSRLVRFAAEKIWRKCSGFYFLSSPEHAGFIRFFPKLPAAFFANFSDAEEPLPRVSDPNDPVHLLFVGRIVRVKGVFTLVDALHRLTHAGRTDVRLTLVGTGPDLEALRRAASPLADRVVFTGYLDGEPLLDQYRSANVFALPTAHPEGFPYVVIEAMRAGLPIVCTREGVLEDLIEEGVNGFKIHYDDAAELADRIVILGDSGLRNAISRNNVALFRARLSRSRAERFYAELAKQHASRVD